MAMSDAQLNRAHNRAESRRKMEETVDNAKFSWFHLKAILVAGVGFYTDAYDLFAISIVKPMIAVLYYPQLNGKLPITEDLWVTGIALAGTLCGQVVFGFCGDFLGRKKVYLFTLLLMIFSIVAQALAASTIRGVDMIAVLCFWRFCMGFAIGGDYPLSATIVSEYSNRRWRGSFLASVFAMQGFGIISGALVGVITLAIFQDSIKYSDITYLDYVWRIIIGFGCVPAVLTIYLRSKLPETPRFTADITLDDDLAVANMTTLKGQTITGRKPMAPANEKALLANGAEPTAWKDPVKRDEDLDRITFRSLNTYLTKPSLLRNRNIWVLFGTCSTWFLLDIAFYSQNLFLPNVLTAIGYNPAISPALPAVAIFKKSPAQYPYSLLNVAAPTYPVRGSVFVYNSPACVGKCAQAVYTKMFKTAAGNAIVAMMGTVPGYWFTIAFVDILGRVPIQFVGFSIMTTILIILAAAYNSIVATSKWLFIVLYALTFFFANFGPNATTFITPVELFQTKYRSTLHGISAASGKAGAIVGAFGIGKAFTETNISLRVALAILASTNLAGMLCTIFVPETKRMTLSDAATKSTSIFGKMLARAGYPQVEPDSLLEEQAEAAFNTRATQHGTADIKGQV